MTGLRIREQETLEKILGHLPVMVCLIGPNGRIEWANNEWTRALGWSLEEARSLDILSLAYPDSAEREEVLRYVLDPPPGIREFRPQAKDGRVVYTSWANVLLSDGSSIGIGQDISERRRAEEELRQAHDEYRRLFENAPIGIFRSTAEGRLLAANPAMARIFGYGSVEEMLTRVADLRDLDLWPGQREEAWPSLLQRGDAKGIELRARRAGGEAIWLGLSTQTIRDADGSVAALEGTVEDITERKNARLAVEDSRHRLQALFDNTLDALLLADDEGRYVDANPAACALLGHQRAELLRLAVADIMPARHRHEGTIAWREFLATGNLRGEHACLCKDGTTREVEFRAAANVLPGLHLWALRDVTERKTVERALRDRNEQQAAVARLGQDALSGLDIHELFDHAARTAAETLRAEYSQLLELLPGGHEMLFRAGVGWGKEFEVGTSRVATGRGSQAGFTLHSGEPIVTGDLARETRFSPSPVLLGHGVVSGVSVIIGGAERPFGVLGVHTVRPRAFSEDDVHFLQSIAHVLAGALLQQQAQDDRLSLLRRLISAQDDERRRTARELHDEAGQALTGVLVGLRGLQASRTLARAKAAARGLRDITSRAITDIGRLARGLHPRVLDDMGLVAAIRRDVAEYTRLHGMEVNVDADAEILGRRLPSALELTLYRVVQEALTNAARHARARRVDIVIRGREEEVDLIVKDDGSGFDVSALARSGAHGRLGLIGMRERVALLGGLVGIESSSATGTTVAVRIPRSNGSRA